MGQAAGPIAAISSIASAGLGFMGSEASASATNAADQYQASLLAEKAQLGKAAAVETNANLTTKLAQSLGNIDAVRAASGDAVTSPTTAALKGATASFGNEEKAIRVGNILSQSEMDTASSQYLQKAGQFALTQGALSGLAGVAGTLGKTNFGSFGIPQVA